MAWLLMFLKSRTGQYIAISIAVCIALLSVRQHYINKGKTEGKQEVTVSTAKTIQENHVADHDDTAVKLSAANERIEQQNALIASSQARETMLASAFQQLVQQKEEATKTVAALSDVQLHDFNTSQIGLRAPQDRTPGYFAGEERAISGCLTQYPLCQKATANLQTDQQEIKNQIADMQKKQAYSDQMFKDLAGYTGRLEAAYVDVYNLIPQKRNKVVTVLTLGLRGKPAKLKVPSPIELQKSKPGAKQ